MEMRLEWHGNETENGMGTRLIRSGNEGLGPRLGDSLGQQG